jgi:hypothetical protein
MTEEVLSAAAPAAATGRWARARPYVVAAFVTLHLLAVAVDLVPYPNQRIGAMKKYADARIEADRVLRFAYRVAGEPGPFPAFRRRMLHLVDRYTETVVTARNFVGHYLRNFGSTQKWNMFAGVPATRPIVFSLDVKRGCKGKFERWLDGRAGQSGDQEFDYRHRKAQESLYLGSKAGRRAYGRYWLRRWVGDNPGKHPAAIRISYFETRTPQPGTRWPEGPLGQKRVESLVVESETKRCKKKE